MGLHVKVSLSKQPFFGIFVFSLKIMLYDCSEYSEQSRATTSCFFWLIFHSIRSATSSLQSENFLCLGLQNPGGANRGSKWKIKTI